LVSITIETVYRLLNWGFLQNGEFFSLEKSIVNFRATLNNLRLLCQSFNANPFLS